MQFCFAKLNVLWTFNESTHEVDIVVGENVNLGLRSSSSRVILVMALKFNKAALY